MSLTWSPKNHFPEFRKLYEVTMKARTIVERFLKEGYMPIIHIILEIIITSRYHQKLITCAQWEFFIGEIFNRLQWEFQIYIKFVLPGCLCFINVYM